MKNVLKVILLLAAAFVLAGCGKEEPLDVSNDPPKGGVAAPMNSTGTGAPAQNKPAGAKAESQ